MFRKASSSMATCPNLNSPTDLADEAEMSTKQHTVPRMLQKGFTLDRNQRTTWLMRPGRKPEIRNIKTIWKRAGAYSTSETADLDGAISGPQGEGKVCRTLTQLRQGGGEIQRAEIGALVSHLETRGDHVIDNLLGSRALNDVVLSVSGLGDWRLCRRVVRPGGGVSGCVASTRYERGDTCTSRTSACGMKGA